MNYIIINNLRIKLMENNSYNYDEQQPFAAAEFAENPEPRCPCILLLDTSGSMEGDPNRVNGSRRWKIYRNP